MIFLKRLIFIRHGESSANAKDIISSDINLYPLTPNGEEQVRFVAGQISALRINNIYSSPLLRARQTAGILSKKTNTEIRIIEELRETDFGTLSDTKLAGRVVDLPENVRREHRVESWESHRRRLEMALLKMEDRSLVVTHGLVIRTIIGKVLGLEMEDFNGIFIRPSSMTTVDADSNRLYSVGNFLISDRIRNIFS